MGKTRARHSHLLASTVRFQGPGSAPAWACCQGVQGLGRALLSNLQSLDQSLAGRGETWKNERVVSTTTTSLTTASDGHARRPSVDMHERAARGECRGYNQQAIKRYAVRAVVRQVMICADDDDIVASRLLAKTRFPVLGVWAPDELRT